MLKKFFFIIAAVTLLTTLYLTTPSPAHVFAGSTSERFPREAPVTLLGDEQNPGRACEKAKTYIATDKLSSHEGEGYAFTVDDRCADFQRRLLDAIVNEDISETRNLISLGANPSTVDMSMLEGVRPLIVAASRDTAIVKVLLDNGADVNEEYCCCASCDSPLTRAIQANKADTVALLLERGANIDYRPLYSDNDRPSAFEQAMRSRNPQIIQHVDEFAEKELNFRIRSRIEKVLRLVRIR